MEMVRCISVVLRMSLQHARYGIFTGATCFGCFISLVCWASQLAGYITALPLGIGGLSDRTPEFWFVFASANRIFAAHYALYPVEVLLLTAVKVLALDRMIDFVESQFSDAMRLRLRRAKVVVMLTIVFGNLIGVAAGLAAVAFQETRAALESEIARAYEGNNSSTPLASAVSSSVISSLKAANAATGTAGSVQEFSEAAVLIFIVASFALTGAFCLRRFANVASSPASRYLRLQIVSTVLYVFVTFLLRAIFLVVFAIGNAAPSSCSDTCGDCQSSAYLIGRYLANTPELRYAVEIISSPLSLLLMLWGMTSRKALEELLPWMRKGEIGVLTPQLMQR